MSVQEGAKYLERPFEGRGILLGGVPGVAPARIVAKLNALTDPGLIHALIEAGRAADLVLLDVENGVPEPEARARMLARLQWRGG